MYLNCSCSPNAFDVYVQLLHRLVQTPRSFLPTRQIFGQQLHLRHWYPSPEKQVHVHACSAYRTTFRRCTCTCTCTHTCRYHIMQNDTRRCHMQTGMLRELTCRARRRNDSPLGSVPFSALSPARTGNRASWPRPVDEGFSVYMYKDVHVHACTCTCTSVHINV